jgi:hypothetical protein
MAATKKKPTVKRAAVTKRKAKPSGPRLSKEKASDVAIPRLLFRGDGKAATKRELNRWESQIPNAWRLVVSGNGGNMGSSWSTTYQVGATKDRRAWVLSMADWGDSDKKKEVPDVKAIAAFIDPGTDDEDAIVQKLLDLSADWFNIDEVSEDGEFNVTLPGFD